MKQYHKIQTLFKRDEKTKQILEGSFTEPEVEYLKDNQWVFTEKVDGTNIRIMWNGDHVVFGGKTDEASIPVFLLYKLQELFEGTPKRQLFKELFGDKRYTGELSDVIEVCLYGEGYGNKIQSAGKDYIPNGVDFVLFDVKIGKWWLQRESIEDIASRLGIKTVPVIGEGTIQDAIEMTRKGFTSQWGNFIAEGIVARPKVELTTRKGDRIIAKIKHRDFSSLKQ